MSKAYEFIAEAHKTVLAAIRLDPTIHTAIVTSEYGAEDKVMLIFNAEHLYQNGQSLDEDPSYLENLFLGIPSLGMLLTLADGELTAVDRGEIESEIAIRPKAAEILAPNPLVVETMGKTTIPHGVTFLRTKGEIWTHYSRE